MSITFEDLKKIKNIDIGIKEYGETSGMYHICGTDMELDPYWNSIRPDSIEATTDRSGNITLICTLSESDTRLMHQREENGWPLFVKEKKQ